MSEITYDKAQKYFVEGKLDESKKICQKILKENPKEINALILISVIAFKTGHLNKSLEIINYALKLYPNVPELYFNKAHVKLEQNEYEEAILNIEKTININEKNSEAYNLKGLILIKQKKYDDALICFNKSIEINNNIDAYKNLAIANKEIKKYDDAIHFIKKSIEIDPNFFHAYNLLGEIYYSQKKFEEAKKNFYIASSLNSTEPDIYNNIATLELKNNNFKEAIINYEKILSLNKNYEFMLGHYIHTKGLICDWNQYDADIKLLEKKIKNFERTSRTFQILSIFDDNEIILTNSKIENNTFFNKNNENFKFVKDSNDKIKIGYYSADFRKHPVGYQILELIKLHNKKKFEVFAFSFLNSKNDEIQNQFKKKFDKFIDVENLSDDEIINLSKKYKINIAIDLMGYTKLNRFPIFEKRCAPIQINFLGYPATTGSKNMDYIIADKIVIPESEKKNFSEKIIYMPNSFMITSDYRKFSDKNFKKEDFGIPESSFVFSNFSRFYKITPKIFKIWMEVLNKTKNSVLWLSMDNNEGISNIKKEAKKMNIDENRLFFAKKIQNFEEHLLRIKLSNLFIDTFPYGSHTTTYDILWAEVPIVTLSGKTFASRVCESILKKFELDELITYCFDEYKNKILYLVNNPNKLEDLKEKIKEKKRNSDFFDSKKYANNLDEYFVKLNDIIKLNEKN